MQIEQLSSAQAALEPRGGRFGVAFDWGFATQIALMSAASLAGVPLGGKAAPPAAALGGLVFAGLVCAQGEALRRGNGWAWRIQLAVNSLLPIGGLLLLPMALADLQHGRFGRAYTALLLLGVSPAEVWLLLQPGSRAWYGHVSPEAASKRHSGSWLVGTIAWAVIGGVIQAFAAAELF